MRRSRIEKQNPRTWLGTDAQVVRHVLIGGTGELATATRVELVRLGIQRDTDYRLPSLHRPLVIACADSDEDECLIAAAERASANHSPLLLACLTERCIRIGPLIEPECGSVLAGRRIRDAGGSEVVPPLRCSQRFRIAEAQPRRNLCARLGAMLICAQTLNFLLGARNHCVLDRVIELNPWSMESKVYRVLKVRQ